MDISKIDRKNFLSYAGRFLILIIIPFIVGAWFFPHIYYMEGKPLTSPQESKSGSELTYAFTHSPSDLAVPQQVNAIFPLANYLSFPPLVNYGAPELCFEDNDSYLVLNDGSKFDPEFVWAVAFNNRTTLTVSPEGTNCTKALANQDNEYIWNAKMVIPTNDSRFKGNISFIPRTLTYPRMGMDFGLLQGLIMIPVCYLFIWYPAAGIWRKLHKGFLEQ